ncbi:MAG: HD domain-containing protein [Anaerolineales bacterium]|nr:HD domain-containing protein [Anaerolineales bacterium]
MAAPRMYFGKNINGAEGLNLKDKLNFRISPPYSAASPAPEWKLVQMLDEADDLLFVMDQHGSILACKARNDSGPSLLPGLPDRLNMREMMPFRTRQKYDQALQKVALGGRFAMFSTVLLLPGKGAAWFEFRLLPAMGDQLVLFVWNISGYRSLSSTITNIPFSLEKMIEGWSRALYLRDLETEDHTRRVTAMTLQLARRLGVPEVQTVDLRHGAVLHDIGKIAIPDEILLKAGALTEDEWQVMRQHPGIAVRLLETIPQIEAVLDIPRSHHEKWDGSGYPDGLAGEHIPLAARLFAFADVYDALTCDRPYRRAWSPTDALEYIHKGSGLHFDPALVPEFIRMVLE